MPYPKPARPAPRPRVAVVGAGIGGLALAAALRARGWPVEVFDQTRRLAEVGAGVQLASTTTRHLLDLGLGPALAARAVSVRARELRDHRDRPVSTEPLGAGAAPPRPAHYAVHRAHLHEILRQAAGPGSVTLAARLVGVRELSAGVELRFADGSRRRADLLVGADGIHSVVRAGLVPDRPVWSGLWIYRGLVDAAALPAQDRRPVVRIWRGPGQHLVSYPVDGGARLSFAATTAGESPAGESWVTPADPDRLRAAFAGWPAAVARLCRAAGPVSRWALHDRPPLSTWHHRRTVLLGDAAHPMLPFLAQGANQAIEDAVELARQLTAAGPRTLDERLAAYAAVRGPHARAAQRDSRQAVRALHAAGSA